MSPAIGFGNTPKRVTFTGDGFTPAMVPQIGGVPCTGVVFVSKTQITALTPIVAGSAVVNVTVGSATLAGGFERVDWNDLPGHEVCCTWYNASHVTTAAGPVVATMADLSTVGANPSNIGLTRQPPYAAADAGYAGYPSIGLAAGKFVSTTNAGGITTGARSIVMIGEAGNSGAGGDEFFWENSGQTEVAFLGFLSNQLTVSGAGNAGASLLAANGAAQNNPAVVVAAYSGNAQARLYVSGLTAVATGSMGLLQDDTGTFFTIGNISAAVRPLNGRFADFLAYRSALSDASAKFIQRTAGAIYGIPIAA